MAGVCVNGGRFAGVTAPPPLPPSVPPATTPRRWVLFARVRRIYAVEATTINSAGVSCLAVPGANTGDVAGRGGGRAHCHT